MIELELRDGNQWRDFWRDERISLVVAGTAEAPHPALEATLRDVVERWPEVSATIAAYVASLAAGEHVPLEPASLGGFDARSCGFDEQLAYSSIEVTDPDQPGRVEVVFYTGFPDGYATYRIILADGHPVALSAFAS